MEKHLENASAVKSTFKEFECENKVSYGDVLVDEKCNGFVRNEEKSASTRRKLTLQQVYKTPNVFSSRQPPKGTEIFVSQLPKDISVSQIADLFEKIGPIYECRLLMKNQKCNRGICYIIFYNELDAIQAINQLNGHDMGYDKKIMVRRSVNNCRLFMGNIPNTLGQDELQDVLESLVRGIREVVIYRSPRQKNINRAFAFIEFGTHRDAAQARQMLIDGEVKLPWDRPLVIDWSVPLPKVDPIVMEKVKVIYLKNLKLFITKKDLVKRLERCLNFETIVKIHKKMDYCFIHFLTRENAEEAYRILLDKLGMWKDKFEGIEMQWARPKQFSNKYYFKNSIVGQKKSFYKSIPGLNSILGIPNVQCQSQNSTPNVTPSPIKKISVSTPDEESSQSVCGESFSSDEDSGIASNSFKDDVLRVLENNLKRINLEMGEWQQCDSVGLQLGESPSPKSSPCTRQMVTTQNTFIKMYLPEINIYMPPLANHLQTMRTLTPMPYRSPLLFHNLGNHKSEQRISNLWTGLTWPMNGNLDFEEQF